jgi:predicted amidophosphoribosyltransferase
VTLGHVYPQGQGRAAKNALNVVREGRAGYDAAPPADPQAVARNVGWTRLITALNADRQWPLKRLFEQLDPILAPDIAIVAVPPHRAFQAFWPTRTLAQRLAADGRIDATACLVRHVTIRRILFGGPSTRALHRGTIRVEEAALIAGRRVLLLDDIAKSGASLVACRELLLEAGASVVQAVALGRVIVGRGES